MTCGKNNEFRFSPALSDLSVCTRSRAAGEEEEEKDAEEAVGAALHHVDGDVVVPPCQEKAQAHPAAEGTTSPWGASSCISV